jgi:predicted HAD superfamily Cof-like phosphohydrolase
MSKSVFEDTNKFITKLGYQKPEVPEIIPNIKDRLDHIQEELTEVRDAVDLDDMDGIVDGLIDLIYIAAGTLEMMNVDSQAHWDEVQDKNMKKERGTVAKRAGHVFDAVKPAGWTPPNHVPILEARGWKNPKKEVKDEELQ